MPDPITSLTNPRVKDLVRLRDRRHRDRTSTFLIEGFRELSRANVAATTIETLYFCPDLYLGSNEPELVAAIEETGAETVELAEAPFRKASYRDRPEGLLAVARQFDTRLESLALPEGPLILVVEAIEKPGNLGTMLRTADAAGCDAVIVCDPTTDPFNPNVVRASTGTLFMVPLAIARSSETLEFLSDKGIRTVATTPDTSLLHTEADLTGPVAIAIGTEQYGLTDTWLNGADISVRIPMAGQADSLNAAMAAGITLFEAVRQRTVHER